MSDLEYRKKHVIIEKHNTSYASGIGDSPFIDPNFNGMNINKWKKQFKLKIQPNNDQDCLIFDMIGIDASIANALRRILIAEVPSIAIHRVYISNNTSVMQDEVLSHRLGLLPLLVNPELFEYPEDEEVITMIEKIPEAKENINLVFNLNITCKKDSSGQLQNQIVYSKHFKWIPIGDQKEKFKDNPPRFVHENILLVKLAEGQTIDLTVHCAKGIGRDHAKWSPVATATYRILPAISFKKPLTEEQAKELVEMCPLKVFEISDKKVQAKHPRKCTVCRECIRKPGWDELVQLGRVRDHFIFSIESTGCISPVKLFLTALDILQSKCNRLKNNLLKETKSELAQETENT